jgi:hypothetical protein
VPGAAGDRDPHDPHPRLAPGRALVRFAEPAGENGGLGFRVSSTLRQLAERAGLSMLEAHRALHQLFDRKLLHLVEDRLEVPDLEALAGCLDRPE